MTRGWEQKILALFLAVFALVAHATGSQPSACAAFGAQVPYCAAESLSSPASPIAVPAAVLPAANFLAFLILFVAFFSTVRDDGRMRLALVRRFAPDAGPWTHRHRNHLAPLASPHGD